MYVLDSFLGFCPTWKISLLKPDCGGKKTKNKNKKPLCLQLTAQTYKGFGCVMT